MTIAFDVRDDELVGAEGRVLARRRRWQTIYPKDGIADSRFEQFELVLDGEPGARGVIIRATDALNNVASARGDVPRRRRRQAVDDGDGDRASTGDSGFGAASAGRGRGAARSRTAADSIDACGRRLAPSSAPAPTPC